MRLRWRHRLGPVQIGGQLGVPASTVHAVLVRCRINRLSHIDRVTGEPIRRYEHPYPGSLIHVDVTKFGNIPDGGGHRFLGRQQSKQNRAARTTHRRTRQAVPPLIGTAFLHTVIDDHSRVAYVEICADEKAETAIGVLHRAVAWFAERGVTVERVLSDNGACYRSYAWRDACAELGITHNAPALPAPDQRQDRAVPPHPGRRLGLRPLLRLRNPTPSGPTRLAPLLQSPPDPLRHRRHPHQPAQQPAWTSQLVPVMDGLVAYGHAWRQPPSLCVIAVATGCARGRCWLETRSIPTTPDTPSWLVRCSCRATRNRDRIAACRP